MNGYLANDICRMLVILDLNAAKDNGVSIVRILTKLIVFARYFMYILVIRLMYV